MYSNRFLSMEKSYFSDLDQVINRIEHVDFDKAKELFIEALTCQEDLGSEELINLDKTLNHIEGLKKDSLGYLDVDECIMETHRLLMKNLLTNNGRFSTEKRFTKFFHPRFAKEQLVYDALQMLCDVVNLIQSEISTTNDKKIRLGKKIQLASLFVYTFLLLHPFSDGNGRTATLLGNYIIGLDLPMYVAISENRHLYLTSLETFDRIHLPNELQYKEDTVNLVFFILNCANKEKICKLWIDSILNAVVETSSPAAVSQCSCSSSWHRPECMLYLTSHPKPTS